MAIIFGSGDPPLLLDAAMGTELERRGARCDLPLWSARALFENPDLVELIHREQVAAGADVLTSNTFRTHRRSLAAAGMGDRANELTRLAVSLARRAASDAGRRILVAGSLSPLEDCYRPDLVPDDASLASEHAEQAWALAEAGADLILCETHNTVRELVAAVAAARATGLPVIASMVTDGGGRLLSGERVEGAARAMESLAPDALGINCVPAGRLAPDLRLLAGAAPERPLAAFGNLGPPGEIGGTVFEHEVPPAEYAFLARSWIEVGARLVGGCCGTTALHTAAMRRMIDGAGAR